MTIKKKTIEVASTTQIEFIDITEKVQEFVEETGIREGQVLIYVPHTTMGVTINHNEPMLLQDFMRILYKLAPVDDQYSHDLFELKKGSETDGRSNGHSHCKSMIMGASRVVPVDKGKLMLTDRESIFVIDFDGARNRDIILQVMGL